MRTAFVQSLTAIARADRNVILITGDLGFGVLTDFAKELPGQYINAGVAEQNMTGLAVGLALEGKTVFTYSICNFPTMRPLEQIRNDACYHKANVKVVTVGGGFCYGPLGMSHFATEDLAVMRALPNMTVLAPGDTHEAGLATRAVYETPGTCYLRLGRGGEARVHPADVALTVGRCIPLVEGTRVVVLTTGGILANAQAAVSQLRSEGLDVGLISMPSVKPIDAETVRRLAGTSEVVVTIEEHNVVGGFGSAVAEVLAEVRAPRARLVRLGVADLYPSVVGDQDYLRDLCGLSPQKIASSVRLVS